MPEAAAAAGLAEGPPLQPPGVGGAGEGRSWLGAGKRAWLVSAKESSLPSFCQAMGVGGGRSWAGRLDLDLSGWDAGG